MVERSVASDTVTESARTTTKPVYLLSLGFGTPLYFSSAGEHDHDSNTYEAGRIRVTDASYNSNGVFEGSVLVYDDESYTFEKLIEVEGTDGISFSLWRSFVDDASDLTTPTHMASGSIDRPSVTAEGIVLQLNGLNYRTVILPPLRCNRANGFNHLVRDGQVLVWQGEKHVFKVR